MNGEEWKVNEGFYNYNTKAYHNYSLLITNCNKGCDYMENATKALLIAGSVLIAIVLIALGVNLLSAGSDTSDQAQQVSNSIDDTIKGQTSLINSALSGLPTASDE